MDDVDTLLSMYVRTKAMRQDRFERLFEGRNEHFIWHIFRMFEAFKTNKFENPWEGEWFTARQAYRLIYIIYDSIPMVMTPVTTAVIQYVIDTWNISDVFGENSVFTHFCGRLYSTRSPPTLGPRQRLTADEFIRLMHI